MSSCYITISYYIISYLYVSYVFCGLVLHCILFIFISIRFDSILFDSILFDWIRFMIFFSIVSHINEWFVSICLSFRLSVYVWISFCFLFSFSYRSSFLCLFFFLISVSSLLPCTCIHADTPVHMNVCSFLWLVHLLQKTVSEESYSNDCIISYLI